MAEANGAASLDRTYCYDARDQLTTRGLGTGCTGADETYTYDDAGNRLTAGATTFAYTGDGQLASCTVGCGSIVHDSAGRMTSLAGWSFLYDAEGRMTSACQTASCTGSGFNRLDATYDGQGHRTQLRETTAAGAVTTTDFRYAGDAITAETVNGVLARTYVTDDTGRITKLCLPDCSGSNPVYLVTWNGHGDALALWRVNADGTLALANSYQYTTWGTPTTTVAAGFTDLSFRFLYVGASDVQWDNAFGLGLLYMHARHYSPVLGRFLQPDPSAAEANLYGYAANSPVTKVDPSGHIAFAIAFVIAFVASDALLKAAVGAALLAAGIGGGILIGQNLVSNRGVIYRLPRFSRSTNTYCTMSLVGCAQQVRRGPRPVRWPEVQARYPLRWPDMSYDLGDRTPPGPGGSRTVCQRFGLGKVQCRILKGGVVVTTVIFVSNLIMGINPHELGSGPHGGR